MSLEYPGYYLFVRIQSHHLYYDSKRLKHFIFLNFRILGELYFLKNHRLAVMTSHMHFKAHSYEHL